MPALQQVVELLERDGALELGPTPGEWPTAPPDTELHELDWRRLFPSRIDERGQADWDLYGDDDWDLPPDVLNRIFGGIDGGAQAATPGWDRCAWYQPIHFHGPAWGIYIYDDCLLDTARALFHRNQGLPATFELAKALLRGAFATLFLHEHYHHKTESLGIRLHVVEQQPRYVDYFRSVYVPATGTDEQIEEGLANADSYHRLSAEPYSKWIGKTLVRLLRAHLNASFASAPPGYRLATGLLDRYDFRIHENLLEAQVQAARLKPASTRPIDLDIATHLNHSLFSVRQDIWTIARAGRSPLMPTTSGPAAPYPRSNVEKYVRAAGYELRKGRGKGSHAVYTKPDSPMIVLPDAKDLSPVVLRNTARALGFQQMSELIEVASA